MTSDDSIFQKHFNGKLNIESKVKIDSREILSEIYTPGVAKVSQAIAKDPTLSHKYTIASNTVAVISDGTAVLGLGDIGPKAALPVMEGKAAIFKEFAGLNAFPICINEKDPTKLIEIIKSISVNFRAINLEDISAPRCFDIERILDEELDIPVMHDDQHGTAIVVLAALKGALKLTNKSNINILVNGAGAAGGAITRLLLNPWVKEELKINSLKVLDSKGVISLNRSDLEGYKLELAQLTKQSETGLLKDAIKNTDVFIGVSAPQLLTSEMVKSMNQDPIIFALSNPIPEIMPEDAKAGGANIIATGRSDFPNQINNALAYPGVFKGLIEGNITKVTDEIKIAAANAIYEYNLESLNKEQIVPSILDKKIPEVIAQAIVNLNK